MTKPELRLRSLIKVVGYEPMNLSVHQLRTSTRINPLELLELALNDKKEYFARYINGTFIGPFSEHYYAPDSFQHCERGFADIMDFYERLAPNYTNVEISENPIIVKDYLKLLVHTHQSRRGVYFTFKFKYLDIGSTKQYPDEQFQFDYFYLFAFAESQAITIGRLWYD